MRNARRLRQLAKTQALHALTFEQSAGRFDQGAVQVAVMEAGAGRGLGCAHGRHLNILTP
jgi:hypothetical protein